MADRAYIENYLLSWKTNKKKTNNKNKNISPAHTTDWKLVARNFPYGNGDHCTADQFCKRSIIIFEVEKFLSTDKILLIGLLFGGMLSHGRVDSSRVIYRICGGIYLLLLRLRHIECVWKIFLLTKDCGKFESFPCSINWIIESGTSCLLCSAGNVGQLSISSLYVWL